MSFTISQAGKAICTLFALLALNAAAGTLYVDINSTNPVSPYSDWTTAATNIQDAVDAASDNDLVLVNDGVYQTGGRVVYGALTNRLAVTKPVTVQSVHGPGVTVIQGYKMPGTGYGDSAVRCAYLTNGAVLSGFSLTNGATRSAGDTTAEQSGGAVWCETNAALSNCTLGGCSAAYYAGGAYSGTLVNCTVTRNVSLGGGGGCGSCILSGCTLESNSAFYGGGAVGGSLVNCTLRGNSATDYGGGACSDALNNCVIIGNSASSGGGGGAFGGTLINCALSGNSAVFGGGGCYGVFFNCLITANSAPTGAGLCSSRAYNCTIIANSAGSGGGIAGSTAYNSLIYLNTATVSSNYDNNSYLWYCCSPTATGNGNVKADPQLASMSHLSATSPCIGAGSTSYASGTDIDGEPWANPPCIGCDQLTPGAVTGPLNLSIDGPTNVAPGFTTYFTAWNEGRISAARWEFDDGTILSNAPLVYHAWNVPGNYAVVLRGYNASNPDGITATLRVQVGDAPARFVAQSNPTPQAPYGSWATAATNIQNAIDAAFPGEVILVSNGVYEAGGRTANGAVTNRVVLTKPMVLRSANGPGVTVIMGYQVPGTTNGSSAVRCVYLCSGAWLNGFTLTNGATGTSTGPNAVQDWFGGGVCCETNGTVVITNCIITGNAAQTSGGGAYYGTLFNCDIISNVVVRPLAGLGAGGGACFGTLIGCNLLGNSGGGGAGGGVCNSTLTNCVLNGNFAGAGGGACTSILYGCVLTNNQGGASAGSGRGGGSIGGLLVNCTLVGNSALYYGGGAAYSGLLGCTVASNRVTTTSGSSSCGGGIYYANATNCSLIGNAASYEGGGAFYGVLYNCLISSNAVTGSSGIGGGVFNAILNSCMVIGNSSTFSAGGASAGALTNCVLAANAAANMGGGAMSATLINCTVVSNSAGSSAGGSRGSLMRNCIVYYNAAPTGPEFAPDAPHTFLCTTTLPSGGGGSFTNAPLFVDQANGNFRLQANSPCINAGLNDYVNNSTDLDGNPRISGGTVDVGAYEFQNPASTISYAWLQQYGLPVDGTADTVDSDHDGMNNWQEWRAGTDPTNALSVLQMLAPTNGASGVTVAWQSVANRSYYLQRSLDLSAQPPFLNVQSNIVGQAGTTTYTDTNAAGTGPFFYRVGVQ